MNTTSTATHPANDSPDAPPSRGFLPGTSKKREIIYGAIGLGTGFIVLPALIYVVGTILLGPYAGGQSLGAFYGAFYGNLLHGVARTWFVALSPYLAIWVVRLSFKRSFFGRHKGTAVVDAQEPGPQAETPQVEAKGARREPFIST